MPPRFAYAGYLAAGASTLIPRITTLFLYLPTGGFQAYAFPLDGMAPWFIDLSNATNSQIPIPGDLWGELFVTQGSISYVFLPRSALRYEPIVQYPSRAPGGGSTFTDVTLTSVSEPDYYALYFQAPATGLFRIQLFVNGESDVVLGVGSSAAAAATQAQSNLADGEGIIGFDAAGSPSYTTDLIAFPVYEGTWYYMLSSAPITTTFSPLQIQS